MTAALARAVGIGMVVPSSNTVLEPELCRLAAAIDGVALHFARVRVTEVRADAAASAQFAEAPMATAAGLLGDARPAAVAWAGTAGSWLGLDHDRRLAGVLAEAAGAPATTSTLALLDACRVRGVTRVALVTPYEAAVVDRIVATFAGAGVDVVAERHLGLTDNHAFGRVGPDVLRGMADGCAGSGADALLVVCTNLRAAPLADELEARAGMPVLDSVAVTLSHALTVADGSAPAPRGGP